MADNTGAIQCVLLEDHANQNSEIGKQNAAAMDMGRRSSGAILWFCFWYFFSKYKLGSEPLSRGGMTALLTGSKGHSQGS